MEYYFLIVFLAIGCYGAVLAAPIETPTTATTTTEVPLSHEAEEAFKQKAEAKLNPIFENFEYFQQRPDIDSSISAPFKEITTCIIEKKATEALKNFLVQAYVEFHKPQNNEKRTNFCGNNREALEISIDCIENAGKAHAFGKELFSASKFLSSQFCESPENFVNIMNLFDAKVAAPLLNAIPIEFRNPTLAQLNMIMKFGEKQNEGNLCLPRRMAELYEMIAIQSQKFPLEIHGSIAQLFHIFYTGMLDFPFNRCY